MIAGQRVINSRCPANVYRLDLTYCTTTNWTSDEKPSACARMKTGPALIPVNWGSATGYMAPSGIKTLGGTLSLEGSSLLSVIVRPPFGAPPGRHTTYGTVLPTGTTTPS